MSSFKQDFFKSPGVGEQVATRIAFLIAGIGMSAWAPLIPFAKERLAVNDGTLGLLLLCLGAGSLAAMPATGVLVGRLGCRRVIVMGAVTLSLSLACLSFLSNIPNMAIALFLFGAGVGTLDVAMNIQAVVVEKASGRPMMSGFHGFYSLGGILGAAGISALLSFSYTPRSATLLIVALLFALLMISFNHHLPYGGHKQEPLFVRPRGKVLLIGFLCFLVFLAEGSVLDWSAVFLTERRHVDPAHAGLGFAIFSIAMTIGRLTGDRIVRLLGGFNILLLGGLCTALGFLVVVFAPQTLMVYAGFALIGAGASNIVPVLFTAAGNQRTMPVGLAIASVATLGYAGILAGPAMIGLIAEMTSLSVAFVMVAAGMLLLAVCAGPVTQDKS